MQMNDGAGRKLVLNAKLCSKTAGFKVSFYITNCLINATGENLLFFYQQPGKTVEPTELDVPKMVTAPIQTIQPSEDDNNKIEQKVHMLTHTREVFAKMEGSVDISDPLHTFTPGTRSRF